MGLARSSYYKAPLEALDETALVERMHAIRGEFQAYCYRRITAQLRAEGMLVNRKRVARPMRLHGMQVRSPRRYVVPRTATMTARSFPTSRRIWSRMDRTSSGWRT